MVKARKKRCPTIKQTANISSVMRAEIEKQGENFETVSSSASNTSSNTTEMSIRAHSKSSNRSERKHVRRSVKIMDEQVIEYENDLVSCYAKTDDTKSYASIDEQIDPEMEKQAEPSFRVPAPIVPLKIIQNPTGQPVRAEYLSDFDLCNAVDPAKPHTQAAKLDFVKRFEAELKFCEHMIEEVQRIITQNHRTDVELKVVRSRDKNQMPVCKIQIIRKIKPVNMQQEIYKNKQLVGFDTFELNRQLESTVPNPKSFVKLPTIYSAINVFNHLKNMISLNSKK